MSEKLTRLRRRHRPIFCIHWSCCCCCYRCCHCTLSWFLHRWWLVDSHFDQLRSWQSNSQKPQWINRFISLKKRLLFNQTYLLTTIGQQNVVSASGTITIARFHVSEIVTRLVVLYIVFEIVTGWFAVFVSTVAAIASSRSTVRWGWLGRVGWGTVRCRWCVAGLLRWNVWVAGSTVLLGLVGGAGGTERWSPVLVGWCGLWWKIVGCWWFSVAQCDTG